jgi:glycosyltransferase involved in cell wall biosynthesis
MDSEGRDILMVENCAEADALICYLGATAHRPHLVTVGVTPAGSLLSQFRHTHITAVREGRADKISIDKELSDTDLLALAGPDSLVYCSNISKLDGPNRRRLSRAFKHWFKQKALIIHVSTENYGIKFHAAGLDDFARQIALPALHVGLLPTAIGDEARRAVAIYDSQVQEALRKDLTNSSVRPLAIVSCFNELDVIEEVVRDLSDQGCDVYVLDNWSTDGTWELLRAVKNPLGSRLKIERFPTEPVEESSWVDILARKEEIAIQHPGRWIIHTDADELRRSPFPGIDLAHALHSAQLTGSNRVDFTVLNFRPVDGGTYTPGTLESAFRYFQFGSHPSYFVQSKAWLQGSDRVNLVDSGGHVAEFKNAVDFRYKFWMKHFPIRSISHGRKKIHKERENRWSRSDKERRWHVHYSEFTKNCSFIWPIELLREYRQDRFYQEYGITVMTSLAEQLAQHISSQIQPLLWQDDLTPRETKVAVPDASISSLDATLHLQHQFLDGLQTAIVSLVRDVTDTKIRELEATTDLRSALSAAQIEIKARDQKITELETALATQERDHKLERQALLEQVAAAEGSAVQMTTQLTELNRALAVDRSRLKQIEKSFAVSSQRTKHLEHEVETWSKQARSLDATRDTLALQLSQAMASLDKEVERVSELTQQLTRMTESRSWHLTGPLRTTSKALRNILQFVSHPLRWGAHRRNIALIASSHLFDRDWYLDRYPDVRAAGLDPLLHFLEYGAPEGRWPSSRFDSESYLQKNPDVREAGVNPLLHYLRFGMQEGRLNQVPERDPSTKADVQPTRQAEDIVHHRETISNLLGHEISASTEIAPVPLNETPLQVIPPARLIAFYLPQFHPIPENDRFWGKGFTEWTNVTRATPQFIGHYQPRLPGDLGFYDLRVVDVQREQVELAKLYGLGGFCFYFYWFNGRRPLERPLEQYLSNTDLDLPFCLCWANENWTRIWDGLSNEVLINQDHSPDDDFAFIEYITKYIEDPRYIRIGGKPLVIVYRPSLLPSPRDTALRWRESCREHGLGEIFLTYVQSFESANPAEYGFDAAIEFPPNNMGCPPYPGHLELLNPSFAGNVYDWDFLVRRSENYQQPQYRLFRGVCPSWDNQSRRPGSGTVWAGSSPNRFRQWVRNALQETVSRFDDRSERLIFVNAWNEWAEGTYLEPDRRYGYAYLQAVRDAIEDIATGQQPVFAAESQAGIIVVGHDAHPHGAQFLALNIMRELRESMGLDAECVLLRGGPLLNDYQKVGPVYVLDDDGSGSEAAHLVGQLQGRGFHTAICNTTASGQFVPALKAAGFKVIALIHELPRVLETYEGRGLKEEARIIATAADAVIFPGSIAVNGFRSFAPLDHARAIHLTQGLYKRNRFKNTADIKAARVQLRERFGLDPDTRIVLGVGFADYRKGIDLFLDIGEQVLSATTDAVCIWVGNFDKAIEHELVGKVRSSRWADRFIFPGFIADTDVFYAGADVFALTSREDPFPSVIMEALEVNVPVVAFEGIGAFDRLFHEHRVGCLVSAFDTSAFARELVLSLERVRVGHIDSSIIKRDFSFRKYVYDLLAIAEFPIKRVSVVVPNYNYCRYLAARLESIERQTVSPYEIIVLDDASTDGSSAWLSDHLDLICPTAELVKNERNSGSTFAQWLAGVQRARGDYVWIAEADDLAEPEFLAETLRGFDKPGVVLSYCQSKQMGPDGEILCDDYLEYVRDISPTKWRQEYTNEGLDEIVTALSVKNTIPNVSGVVFKRDILLDALERLLPNLKTFRVAGDWIVYIEMLRRGRIAFSPKALNLHRRHASSVTLGSFDASHLREILLVQQMVRADFSLPASYVRKATSYSETLFKQFGLDSPEAPSISQHQELRSVI